MKKQNKLTIILGSILGVLVLTLGIAYAIFSYQEESLQNSELITGDIYMYYNETSKTINISNLMPSEEYPETDYFEFKVSGKNTYNKKDIYYEIVLDNGEYEGDDLNRTIPIDSQLLRFRLVEVVDGEEIEIFNNRTYSDITNKRIHVDTIGSDDGNYSKTYRLYARISEYVNICGGEVTDGCDYYVNPSEENANLDWNKLYSSIKVNVKGDLEEKSIETDASCFTYEITSVENPVVNPVMASQEVVDNELTRCIKFFNETGAPYDEGSDGESFCKGTGTITGGVNLQQFWDNTYQQDGFMEQMGNELVNNNIMILENDTYKVNPVMETQEYNELTSCVSYFSNNYDFTLAEGEDWISFCQGSGTLNGSTFQNNLDNSTLEDIYLINLYDLNIINGDKGIWLTSYDQTCGSDIVIPRKIDEFIVTKIGDNLNDYGYPTSIFGGIVKNVVILDNIKEIGSYAFWDSNIETIELSNDSSIEKIGNSAFSNTEIMNIVIPNSVTTIDSYAFNDTKLRNITLSNKLTTIEADSFRHSELTRLEIPDSVTIIGDSAFIGNQLTSVKIPNSVTTIGSSAFNSNQLTSVAIPDSVTTIGNWAFNNNQLTSVVIPDSVTTIGDGAFQSNQLTSVVIPDSVTTIGSSAFSWNQLETVTIGSAIQYISSNAFSKHSLSNLNLSSITFTSKTCEEIKNIEASSTDTTKYFPWLYTDSPYYQTGYTATIIGTDGVCSY